MAGARISKVGSEVLHFMLGSLFFSIRHIVEYDLVRPDPVADASSDAVHPLGERCFLVEHNDGLGEITVEVAKHGEEAETAVEEQKPDLQDTFPRNTTFLHVGFDAEDCNTGKDGMDDRE